MKSANLSLGRSEFSNVNSDGTVTIVDSELLLSGDYTRDGDDLVLTGSDGQQLHVVEYFSQSEPPALISSDGKMLSGDTVSLLAGPQAPGQYAQSTGGQFGDAIGQVETLDGPASAQRPNGLTVELEVGSLVYQGDVVSAGANSTVGITFLDKTVFTIAEGGTMVLNEMVYDPSGSSNSMLFNLLGGTAAFVAGAVAKTGDMKIETPVAVMAIRGTEPFASCQSGASCYFGGASGKYELLHKVLGNVLATVDDPARVVTLDSINGTPSIGGANALQQATMGQMFQALRDAVRSLDERLGEGEDPVREAGTGSPDFAENNFLEDIGGFFFAPVNVLLNQTNVERTIEEIEDPEPQMDVDPPLIVATNEDTSFIFEVITEDDLLALGGSATIISATVVSGLGTATPNEDGRSVTYDPGDEYNSLSMGETASVQVSVVIDLGDGTTETITAFVTVLGINDLPTANPDTAATDEATLISIDVLNNDTDPDANDDLVVSQATIVSGLGTVSIAAGGSAISYDPAGDYEHLSAGETTEVVIKYRLSDGNGGFSTSTATVTVTGLNDGPAFGTGDNTGQVTERADGSGGENIAVLNSSGKIAFSDVDAGDVHEVSFEANGGDYRGTFSVEVTNLTSDDGDGKITWNFDIDDADIDDLAAGQTLTQVYTITIDDGNGGVITKDVTIKLHGTNDAPVTTGSPELTGLITEETDETADENSITHKVTGKIAFADVDLTDTHTVDVTKDGSGYLGKLVAVVSNDSDGDGAGKVTWTFTADDADLDYLAATDTLTQTYTLTIDDGQGGTATETVTITIQGTNDAPVITGSAREGSVTEVTDKASGENTKTLTAGGSLSLSDVDLADAHTVSVIETETGYRGELTASISDASQGDGSGEITWLFSISDGDIDDLAAGETLTQVYRIKVDDGNGGTDTKKVTITLVGTNDAPVVTAVDTKGTITEFDEDAEVASSAHDPLTGTIDFADVDLIDTHEVGITVLGTGYFGELTATVSDDTTGDGTGQVSWTFNIDDSEIDHLGADDVLVQKYRLTIDDGEGGTISRVVRITIEGSNDSPIITSSAGAGSVTELADGSAGENSQLLTTDGTLDFIDVDLSDGHTVSVGAHDTGYRGTLTATVSDASQGDGSGEITWTFTVNDADLDDLLDGQMLEQTYVITVDDGQGGTSTQTVVIQIFGSNDGPVIIDADDTGAVVEIADNAPGENIDDLITDGSISVSDDDLGDVNTVTVAENGADFRGTLEAVVSPVDGSTIDWTFTVNDAAIDDLAEGQTLVQQYTLTISDGFGSSVEQIVEITITGTNDAPVITSAAGSGDVTELADGAAGENNTVLNANGVLDFEDVDLADGHTVGVSENDGGYRGSLTANVSNLSQGDGSGEIAWTFNIDDADLDDLAEAETLIQTYTITVTDANGATDTQQITITLTGSNDAPDITSGAGSGMVTEIDDGAAGETTDDLTTQGTLDFGDVDLADDHTVSVTEQGSDFRGTLTASISDASQGDGSGTIAWSFTVNDGDVDDLAAGETLTQTYTVTVIDPNGAIDTQEVTITIVGTNDDPVYTGGPDAGAVTELDDGDAGENTQVLTANGTIAFGDVDLADGHTLSITPSGDGYLGNLTASVSNSSQGDGSGEIAWTFQVSDGDLDYLSANDVLVQTYTVEIDDGNGGTDTQTVTITIQGTNDAPVITTADTSGSVEELADGDPDENTLELTAQGTIDFDDVDVNDTHTVSVSAIGSAPRGTLTAVVSGSEVTWTFSVIDGELDDLAEGDTVIQSYWVTIDDGNGGTDQQMVDITLTGTNDVAIISGTTTGMVIEDDAIDTIGGLLEVVDPDVRQDGTVEAAFVAAVIMGTYGSLTIAADGAWSYTLDNSLDTTDALVFGDNVTDSFTVSTIDGTTQVINVSVSGVGFDFEFDDFGGNSGSSDIKLLDAGTIESIDIDLLITPMPLTILSGGSEIANKVNATQSDLGVGTGQDVADDEGLRFEFITQSQVTNNNIATLSYVSHISLVLFQAELSQVQGSQSATSSILLRIVNADNDNNFDTMNDAGDVVIALSVSDVTVTVADGNAGNYEIIQLGDTVVITGLQEGDTFTIESSTAFNRVELENAGDLYGGNTFEVGVLGFNMPEELILEGDGTSAPLIGGDSNDTLNSGPGQQELTGGSGVDLFVFDSSASMGALADIIVDYEADVDVVDLTGLFDVAPGDFTEAAVEEYVRYLSGDDNDGGSDPSGSTGDLFVDVDGDANGENFVLLAHSNTQTDNLILKVDDGTDIGYVTIV